VLIDAYIFIILVHSSITWLPQEMASQEYMTYAPVDMVIDARCDSDLWVLFLSHVLTNYMITLWFYRRVVIYSLEIYQMVKIFFNRFDHKVPMVSQQIGLFGSQVFLKIFNTSGKI